MATDRKSRKKRIYIILTSFLFIIIIVRLILPYYVLKYVNKSLAEMHGYYGQVYDVDLAIYRGAYKICDLYLNKVDTITKKQTEFFKVHNIDLSVEWRALFQGEFVGEIEFNSADLIFTKDEAEIGEVKKDTTDFLEVLDDLMPLRINTFTVNDSRLHYVDNTSKPKVDVSMKNINMIAENLTNVKEENIALPSSLRATSDVYEGTMTLNMKMNPLAKPIAFDLNAEVKNTNLKLLNDFLKAYGNFDVNKGRFGLYTELATKDNKFKGYVKPVITDLDVVGPEDRNDAFFHKLWESLVGAAGVILKNPKEKQVATKIPLEGSFKDPETDVVEAVWEVLRNAFIQALMPSIDNQINLKSVEIEDPKDDRNLFQRIFSKDEKKAEEKEKKKEEREQRKEERKENKGK